jgi:hypothetical protein
MTSAAVLPNVIKLAVRLSDELTLVNCRGFQAVQMEVRGRV